MKKLFLFLRSLLGSFIVFPVVTLFLSIWMNLSRFFPGFEQRKIWIAQAWARSFLKWFRVHVQVEGLENLPSAGAVLIFNHRSFTDIFVLVSVLDKFRFGAKSQLFRIPFFGQAMRSFGAISIPRENRIQALKEYDRARDLFSRGEHILLAPEGTRNSSQEILLPFKSGPFLLAQSAGVPLVPVLLSGTDLIWPKHSFFPGMLATSFKVKVRILSSVPVARSEDHKKLKEILRDRMWSHLEAF